MNDDQLTIAQHVRRGEHRATCPRCRWAGPWENAGTPEGRRHIIRTLDEHLHVVHGLTRYFT